jgi:DNA gyrase subunit A
VSDNLALPMHSVENVTIENEMRKSYLDYAMSVIVSRALPDVRDGLKPVHRRILYAMHEINNYYDKPYKKCAKAVGDVLGKYHPHGSDAIYFAMVRLAQDFALRDPLIDGQGNFGSIDGDAPAAMRYTEARLSKLAGTILEEIDLGTVDFQDNYDGSEREPAVLPAQFPNLLVNGANGIAVGMATNIPSHNLGEVLDACCAYIENSSISIEELLQLVPGPDFPTGGIIVGQERARIALATGRGSIVVRGKTDFEEIGGRNAIVVKELPYQVNKAELLKHIEYLAKEKQIEGIHEMRDETNKLGIRMVIELKKDAIPEVILNQLYKYTALQSSFAVNMLALNKGRPMLMNIRDVIVAFIDFREEVVTKRISYLLTKARNRAHTLIGLSLAVANIDEVIALIKASSDPSIAKARLMEKFWEASSVIPLLKLVDDYRNTLDGTLCKFTEEQATAILEMRLQRLTGLEKEKIEGELIELGQEISEYLSILESKTKLFEIITNEFKQIKEKFATPRRTEIQIADDEVDMEDLIAREDMVVTITMSGYIKRVPLVTYRAQRRGGKGRSAMTTYDDDATTDIIVSNTHAPMLFFSDLGKVYRLKVYRLPIGTPQSKGKALVNLLPLSEGERITRVMPLPEDQETWNDYSIVFATAKGNVRRNDLSIFSNIQANGKIAIKLDEDDKLIGVLICKAEDHILLCSKNGKALRFPVDDLRIFKSRSSDGVRGIRLANKNDAVVSMAALNESRVDIEKRADYLKLPEDVRIAYKTNKDKAPLEAALQTLSATTLTIDEVMDLAENEQFILTVTEKGYGKRTSAYEYRITGRGGQGVMNIDTGERNGTVVASLPVDNSDQIILLTNAGTLIRTNVNSIRITGRSAMGVRVMNIDTSESLISLTRVSGEESEEEGEEDVSSVANEN